MASAGAATSTTVAEDPLHQVQPSSPFAILVASLSTACEFICG